MLIEYNKVNIVVCNLCAKLLFPTEMSGKIFMNAEVCGFLNKSAGSACCEKIMLNQYMSVRNAQIFH